MLLVCSNKPRPSVHRSGKGHQHWKRDVHHIATVNDSGRLERTLCNINASEWLVMGDGSIPSTYADDGDLCQRCKLAFEALA